MFEKTVVEAIQKLDSRFLAQKTTLSPKISELAEGFLKHGQFDLSWSTETVRKYGECLRRNDKNPALFVTFGEPKRLGAYDLSKQFRHYAEKAEIKKKVTPHILRHTAATIMSHKGADIRIIQQILVIAT